MGQSTNLVLVTASWRKPGNESLILVPSPFTVERFGGVNDLTRRYFCMYGYFALGKRGHYEIKTRSDVILYIDKS